MGGYYPDGCTQGDIDRAANGWDWPLNGEDLNEDNDVPITDEEQAMLGDLEDEGPFDEFVKP